jgi:predicted nucleic acid-binding protein
MSTFVDTSAILTVADRDDSRYDRVDPVWRELCQSPDDLVTTSYVLLESFALMQQRVGVEAVRALHEEVVPALTVVWVDESLRAVGMEALLAAGRRHLSLVDCVSFAVMRQIGIDRAFTLDRHSADQGFGVVP